MAAIFENRRPLRTDRLSEKDWADLLRQIHKGKCTPFIGPEVCKPIYPTKRRRARTWAKQENYPLRDRSELASVSCLTFHWAISKVLVMEVIAVACHHIVMHWNSQGLPRGTRVFAACFWMHDHTCSKASWCMRRETLTA